MSRQDRRQVKQKRNSRNECEQREGSENVNDEEAHKPTEISKLLKTLQEQVLDPEELRVALERLRREATWDSIPPEMAEQIRLDRAALAEMRKVDPTIVHAIAARNVRMATPEELEAIRKKYQKFIEEE